ncbi:unnamed protein product [Sphenostylis stenocarpa]|uniref:Uncharacterized protein n=1 Tax=Sphenostylis stenocarpa TaxID=92480 RepID=A0AA86VTC7_9FABA|nr:unnamed protein product [Sphenostylis stenocarpa]
MRVTWNDKTPSQAEFQRMHVDIETARPPESWTLRDCVGHLVMYMQHTSYVLSCFEITSPYYSSGLPLDQMHYLNSSQSIMTCPGGCRKLVIHIALPSFPKLVTPITFSSTRKSPLSRVGLEFVVNWEGIISGIPSQTPVDENQSGECGPLQGAFPIFHPTSQL